MNKIHIGDESYLNELFNEDDFLCNSCLSDRFKLGYNPAILEKSWERLVCLAYGVNHVDSKIKKPTYDQHWKLKELNNPAEYFALDFSLNPNGNLVDLRDVAKRRFLFQKGDLKKVFKYEFCSFIEVE